MAGIEDGAAWWCFLGLCPTKETLAGPRPRPTPLGVRAERARSPPFPGICSEAASGPAAPTELVRSAVPVPVPAASGSPPVSRRLLKFGVRWLASPLRNHHAIKEFFLEICVPMGSN